jgi:DNA-binding XRE family transcriptional regulator
MTLGEKLKEARIKAGLTQEKLARLLDVTTQTIYKLEKDKHAPSFALVKRMAEVLKVAIGEL